MFFHYDFDSNQFNKKVVTDGGCQLLLFYYLRDTQSRLLCKLPKLIITHKFDALMLSFNSCFCSITI